MQKKRQEEKTKKVFSGIVFKVAVVLASVYLLVAFVGGQMQVAEKQRELEAVEAQVQQQTVKNAELQRLMESGDEDAYVERIAREQLGYARPDERVFVDISGQ